MPVTIRPGALGRPVEEFLLAVDICAEEWRRDGDNAWVAGMVAAGWWICGFTPNPPMAPDQEATATRREIVHQLLLAGSARLDKAGPNTPQATWARGVYRMLIYAIGYTDELPLQPRRRAPAPA